MTGVGYQHAPVGCDTSHKRRRKTPASTANQAVIQVGKHFRGIDGKLGNAAYGPDQHGDEHGGWQSLAGNIADDDKQASVADAEDLKEIPTYFLGGLVDALNAKSGDSVGFLGQQKLLHLLRGGQIVLKLRLAPAHSA